MDDIFLTDRCILMSYTPGSSGKFLINCLAFHSKCQPQTLPVFSDHNYQIKFINSKLESFVRYRQPKEWDDLNMGDREFFNVYSFYHMHIMNNLANTPELIPKLIKVQQQNILTQASKNITPCIEKNKFFFKEVHSPQEISFYSKVWPGKRIIHIDNTQEYIKLRYAEGSRERIRAENFHTRNNFDPSILGDHVTFDCMSFLNWLTFYQEYVKLLAHLELEPENIDELKHFYTTYMKFWFPNIDTNI